MPKVVSIILSDEVLRLIDEEALRRKMQKNNATSASEEEIREAVRISNAKGSAEEGNRYLKDQRQKRLDAISGSASRHGIVLEFVLKAAESLKKVKPATKKSKAKATDSAPQVSA